MLAWFSRLAGRSDRRRGAQAYPVIDAKTVIYAVGDIHGRADLLGRVHEAIERDWRARPAERRLEIYLGDYVDRGPDSAAVDRYASRPRDKVKAHAAFGQPRGHASGFP